jgi:hypothetical protein
LDFLPSSPTPENPQFPFVFPSADRNLQPSTISFPHRPTNPTPPQYRPSSSIQQPRNHHQIPPPKTTTSQPPFTQAFLSASCFSSLDRPSFLSFTRSPAAAVSARSRQTQLSLLHPTSSNGSFCPQLTDPAFSPSTDHKQHHRTALSPPTRERAEPFPISSDPRLPIQLAVLSFLSRCAHRLAATLFPPAVPTEAAPPPTENRRSDLQLAESNKPREREKPEEIR